MRATIESRNLGGRLPAPFRNPLQRLPNARCCYAPFLTTRAKAILTEQGGVREGCKRRLHVCRRAYATVSRRFGDVQDGVGKVGEVVPARAGWSLQALQIVSGRDLARIS